MSAPALAPAAPAKLPVPATLPPLVRTPIQHATVEAIKAAIDAASVGTRPGIAEWLPPKLIARRALPEPFDLICDVHGPAGWVGLFRVPSTTGPDVCTLEISTYLAPRLRGTGALPTAFYWQAHMVADLHRNHPRLRVIASIADWNTRSQAAFRRYADTHGWPPAWQTIEEPDKQRTSLILDWPVPVPHTCML